MNSHQPISSQIIANREIEQALLACLMTSVDVWERLRGMLVLEDFGFPEHRLIFGAMNALDEARQSVTNLQVADMLQREGHLKGAGGLEYLASIVEGVYDADVAEEYLQSVVDYRLRRDLAAECAATQNASWEPKTKSAIDIVTAHEDRLARLTDVRELAEDELDPPTFVEGVKESLEARWKSDSFGVKTGFSRLDELTNGLQPAKMVVLAARPSVGKTSLACNIAENVFARQQRPVMIFSFEMTRDEILLRMLSSATGIPHKLILDGRLDQGQRGRLNKEFERLRTKPIAVVNKSGLTVQGMRSYVRLFNRHLRNSDELELVGERSTALVVIDYLQLVHSSQPMPTRNQEVGEISRATKDLAMEFGIPVLVLSQLNRAVESRMDKRPRLADLRDSGEIEQDADLVMMIYREELYNEGEGARGVANILIEKNRSGPIGEVELRFAEKIMKFEDDIESIANARSYREGSS